MDWGNIREQINRAFMVPRIKHVSAQEIMEDILKIPAAKLFYDRGGKIIVVAESYGVWSVRAVGDRVGEYSWNREVLSARPYDREKWERLLEGEFRVMNCVAVYVKANKEDQFGTFYATTANAGLFVNQWENEHLMENGVKGGEICEV